LTIVFDFSRLPVSLMEKLSGEPTPATSRSGQIVFQILLRERQTLEKGMTTPVGTSLGAALGLAYWRPGRRIVMLFV
jgi:hypothetical protein